MRGAAIGSTPAILVARWTKALLQPALDALGLESRVVAGAAEGGDFPELRVLNALELPANVAGWAKSSSLAQTTPELTKLTADYFQDDIVIGGMPIWMMDALTANGNPAIGFDFNSIRFAPDVFLNFFTNSAAFAQCVSPFSVSDDIIRDYASEIKSRVHISQADAILKDYRRAFIFFGQTEVDFALVRQGKLASLDQYTDTILSLAQGADCLLFKKHPYANSTPALAKIAGKMPCYLISGPVYNILASDAWSLCAALSSGVIDEARFFGKTARRLFDSDLNFVADERFHFKSRVLHTAFSTEAAVEWLRPLALSGLDAKSPNANRPTLDLRTEIERGRLRRSLGLSWGRGQDEPIEIKPLPGTAPVRNAAVRMCDVRAGTEGWEHRIQSLGLVAGDQGWRLSGTLAELELKLGSNLTSSSVIVSIGMHVTADARLNLRVVGDTGRALQQVRFGASPDDRKMVRFRLSRQDGFDGECVRFKLDASSPDQRSKSAGEGERGAGLYISSIHVDRAVSFG